jgi:hypothetical protein
LFRDVGTGSRFKKMRYLNKLDGRSDAEKAAHALAAPGKTLGPQARRALEEAASRKASEKRADRPAERGGRQGPEPTRYGDWEIGGIATDF